MPSKKTLANAIRALSIDAVQRANSGHPGAPLGMADIAEVLWRDFLIHNPKNPKWANRDRFVLSNGHGSMLLYSLLHLTGYDVTIDDIKKFRQLHSKTAGHPEYDITPGVETTTGPLGQGLANAVGFAIAEKTLAAQFNKDNLQVIDHYTYAFLGDGCLMEGISHEVCSLAGTLKLGKLIALYDDNGISIDGEVKGWFTDNTTKRFESYGWQVIAIDGHNVKEIQQAIISAQQEKNRPTLIACKTIIGYGSPNKSGKASSHGAPLGEQEVKLVREKLGWEHPSFIIPEDVYQHWNAEDQGRIQEEQWHKLMDIYTERYPDFADDLKRRLYGSLPEDFDKKANQYIHMCQQKSETIATRKASQNAIESYAQILPELLGGSADLAGSNLTLWSGSKPISKTDAGGNYIYYGVREFGMSAIMNGIALHGGFIPYGATFLIFMEYARNAVRMASLMKQHCIFVYTHDSIGLGEDGPTHQPVEQLSHLRSTPNLHTWRPCDSVESAVAWKHAIQNCNNPSALVFSRQGLPCISRSQEQIDQISLGGYIIKEHGATADIILIATGSEVQLALQASEHLEQKHINVRVISMPCPDLFEIQDQAYKESVLPSHLHNRIAIEAAHEDFWYKYVGLKGKIIGMKTFGESGPAKDLFKLFNFTVDHVVNTAESML